MQLNKYGTTVGGSPSFSQHYREIYEHIRLTDDTIKPTMTVNEVHYRLGQREVISEILRRSETPSMMFELNVINELMAKFKSPELNYETPIEEIMFYSGREFVISQIHDWMVRGGNE